MSKGFIKITIVIVTIGLIMALSVLKTKGILPIISIFGLAIVYIARAAWKATNKMDDNSKGIQKK